MSLLARIKQRKRQNPSQKAILAKILNPVPVSFVPGLDINCIQALSRRQLRQKVCLDADLSSGSEFTGWYDSSSTLVSESGSAVASSTTASDTETEVLWDNSFAELPEDKLKSNDDGQPAACQIEYFNTSCPRLTHRFLKFAQTISEESCHDFLMASDLKQKLEDYLWRKNSLSIELVDRQWLIPGQVELYYYARLFKGRFPISNYVLWSAENLRHAAIHRHPLPLDYLRSAIQLPAQLSDTARGAHLKHVFNLVTKSCPSPAEVEERERVLFAAKPIVTLAHLNSKIQDLLEESAMKMVQREEPKWLAKRGVTCHEQIELNEWLEHLERSHRDKDGWSWTMTKARDIRDAASHRLPFSQIRQKVSCGVDAARLLGDLTQAEHIQGLIDEWFEREKSEGRDHDEEDKQWTESRGLLEDEFRESHIDFD